MNVTNDNFVAKLGEMSKGDNGIILLLFKMMKMGIFVEYWINIPLTTYSKMKGE